MTIAATPAAADAIGVSYDLPLVAGLTKALANEWVDPSDIAGAVLFLCSPAASCIHGAILPVDGGWLAR